MDRELVLAVLVVALTGLTLQLGARWPRADSSIMGSACQAERRCWRHLWLPLAPMALVLCAIAGWAAREPRNAERLPPTVLIVTAPFALVWMRAIWRASQALRRRPPVGAAGVIGLWRPRILISDQFRARVDQWAIAAAVAHEGAHVRHRDPLRLWVAQFVTDLQWPSARATSRLRAWTRVLERARDDDARLAGIEGADLAAAILAAVRLSERESSGPALTLTGEPTDLETRIRRLLEPAPVDTPMPSFTLPLILAAAPALLGVAIAGALSGETLVRTVFSALR